MMNVAAVRTLCSLNKSLHNFGNKHNNISNYLQNMTIWNVFKGADKTI